MNSDTNTAVSTALAEFPTTGKTLLPFVQEDKTRQSADSKAKPSSQERGVWLEHGKWTAAAGFDPVTKKRLRKSGFASETEAIEWRAKQLGKKASDQAARRQKVREISESEMLDATEALELLSKAGLVKGGILRITAEYFIARHPEAVPTTVRQFYENWINAKEELGRRYHTLSSAKSTMTTFLKRWGECPMVEINFNDHIRPFVFDPAIPNHTTRRGRGVVITNFFNMAQKRGIIGADPMDHPCFALELPPKPEMEPDPWSVSEFKTLLAYAWATEDVYHTTAYIALGGLAGVRTEELSRLRFGPGGVDIDKGTIRITADKSKKRRARLIDMEPGLQRILKALRDRPRVRLKYCRPFPRPGDDGAKVYSKKLLLRFKEGIRTPLSEGGAGMEILDEGGDIHTSKNKTTTFTSPSAWRDNGLRSAFATYHFERCKVAEKTAAIMGHTSGLNVFFHHYRVMAENGDGNAYFAVPDQVLAENPTGAKPALASA